MAELIDAFQCRGCGKIDAPRECIGICEDRALQIVTAGDLLAERERAEAAEREIERLKTLVRQLARVRPAAGREAENLAVLRRRARALLGDTTDTGDTGG